MKRSTPFRLAAKLRRAKLATLPNEFGAELPRRKVLREPPIKTGVRDAEPDRDSKTGVSAGYRIWGRHGFDGNGCGQEACRGSRTLNRVKQTQLPTQNWLTQLN